ncbi:MAG: hypothetical protein EBU90_17170 [Proteobacteria bacterium]|nr:hypothetical protein [Pseudomonadota bacterium]
MFNMSATTENLLLQIIELEQKILEVKSRGQNSFELEETLVVLKGKFAMMNEALSMRQGILKG